MVVVVVVDVVVVDVDVVVVDVDVVVVGAIVVVVGAMVVVVGAIVVVVGGMVVVVVSISVVVTPAGSGVVVTAARSSLEGVVPVATSKSFMAESRAASSSVAAESRDSDSALRAAFSSAEQVTVVVEMVVAKTWREKNNEQLVQLKKGFFTLIFVLLGFSEM